MNSKDDSIIGDTNTIMSATNHGERNPYANILCVSDNRRAHESYA